MYEVQETNLGFAVVNSTRGVVHSEHSRKTDADRIVRELNADDRAEYEAGAAGIPTA